MIRVVFGRVAGVRKAFLYATSACVFQLSGGDLTDEDSLFAQRCRAQHQTICARTFESQDRVKQAWRRGFCTDYFGAHAVWPAAAQLAAPVNAQLAAQLAAGLLLALRLTALRAAEQTFAAVVYPAVFSLFCFHSSNLRVAGNNA